MWFMPKCLTYFQHLYQQRCVIKTKYSILSISHGIAYGVYYVVGSVFFSFLPTTERSILYAGVCNNDLLPFYFKCWITVSLFIFLHQIANAFGPAFLLKLYVAGAITGSAFFLLEKAFLAPGKQVRMHSVYIHQEIGLQMSIYCQCWIKLPLNY